MSCLATFNFHKHRTLIFFLLSTIIQLIILFLPFGSIGEELLNKQKPIDLTNAKIQAHYNDSERDIVIVNKIEENIQINKEKNKQSHAGDFEGKFLPFWKVTTRPEVYSFIKPPYPPQARQAQIEGTVVLRVYIDKHGIVKHIKIIKRAGYGFDEAAILAMRSARFYPATYEGKAVPVWINIPVIFKLEDY